MDKIKDVLEQYPEASRDNLIPILQDVQETLGYLSEDAVKEVGAYLKLPASKIFGVATFYNQFRFEPKGRFHIQVCRGTACHVLNSATVLQKLEKLLKLKAGRTSRDGLFSIEVVACIGACGLAPVLCVNNEFHAKVSEESLEGIVAEYQKSVENEE
jgi:NADH:ubiquinone oxidoreductase subunit E